MDERAREDMEILASTVILTWLKRGLYILGSGLMISLSTTALVKAAIAGWIMLPPEIWWGVMVGLVCSLLCTVADVDGSGL